MLVAIVLILPIVYLIFLYRDYVGKYKDIEKISGPSIIDIINCYRTSSEGLIHFFQSLNSKYGPIVKIWIKPTPPIIITTDIEFFEKIYKSNDNFFTPMFSEAKSLFRNGILTTTSKDNWKNYKQVIMKALTPNYISNRLIFYNKKYNEFIETICDNLQQPFEVESNLKKLLAEILIESMMDPQIKITREEIAEYSENYIKCMDLVVDKLNSRKIGILYKFTDNYRSFLKCAERNINIMENLVERHKQIPQDQRESTNLIYAFLNSGMSDDEIVDNMNSMIGGGFETSVIPLSLCLHELGKRPELQEKILDEIISILGPDLSREITLNDLNNMNYLQCVVSEALRLHFPSAFIDRLVMKDVQIKDMLIPKDTHVIFHYSEIFKSDENFENANVFNPDRFLPENLTENAKRVFLPFGYGTKTCPGKKTAYAVLKLFLVKIVREFKISSVNENKIELRNGLTFKSVNGIPVIFQKRNFE